MTQTNDFPFPSAPSENLSSPKIFGTDGVRGAVMGPLMNPLFLSRLGFGAALAIPLSPFGHRRIVIGGDTRDSRMMITYALSSGFMAAGYDVWDVGVLPTPALALLAQSYEADFAVVISASHNPAHDNGVKFFGSNGSKLPDAVEEKIEKILPTLSFPSEHLPSNGLGKYAPHFDGAEIYLSHLRRLFSSLNLSGLTIVVDGAHGALSELAPGFLRSLGARVISIGCSPSGHNINQQVGATSPQTLQETVLSEKASIGIGFDGDGDRLVIVTADGTLLDGDQILAFLAFSWSTHGRLSSKNVIGTVMANRGLQVYLQTLGLDLIRAPVGDRFVAEYMSAHQASLGGEASGHIILSPHTQTGDGLLTFLEMLRIITQEHIELKPLFNPMPQVHRNVSIRNRQVLQTPDLRSFLEELTEKWRHECSILVRPSGTEPLVRVTLQGEDPPLLEKLSSIIVQQIQDVDAA